MRRTIIAGKGILPQNDRRGAGVRPAYLEALTLVERLHRRLLDVIKDEFDRRGRGDVNACKRCCFIISPTRS
jgi:hypothetical protein